MRTISRDYKKRLRSDLVVGGLFGVGSAHTVKGDGRFQATKNPTGRPEVQAG